MAQDWFSVDSRWIKIGLVLIHDVLRYVQCWFMTNQDWFSVDSWWIKIDSVLIHVESRLFSVDPRWIKIGLLLIYDGSRLVQCWFSMDQDWFRVDSRWIMIDSVLIQLCVSSGNTIVDDFRLIPESCRWLLNRDRKEEVKKILNKAAKVNKTHFLEKSIEDIPPALKEGRVWQLFSSRVMTIRTLILYFNW